MAPRRDKRRAARVPADLLMAETFARWRAFERRGVCGWRVVCLPCRDSHFSRPARKAINGRLRRLGGQSRKIRDPYTLFILCDDTDSIRSDIV